jgi:hypothetical protein
MCEIGLLYCWRVCVGAIVESDALTRSLTNRSQSGGPAGHSSKHALRPGVLEDMRRQGRSATAGRSGSSSGASTNATPTPTISESISSTPVKGKDKGKGKARAQRASEPDEMDVEILDMTGEEGKAESGAASVVVIEEDDDEATIEAAVREEFPDIELHVVRYMIRESLEQPVSDDAHVMLYVYVCAFWTVSLSHERSCCPLNVLEGSMVSALGAGIEQRGAA